MGKGRTRKSQKMCQKNVYTSGGGSDMKKSKNVSKQIVYTSGEGSEKLYNCILVICRQILETGLALGKK